MVCGFIPWISSLSLCTPLAIEAQTFSLQEPGYFFSMYSPPRTDAAYKPARARLEEDLRFASRMVRSIWFYYWSNLPCTFHSKITNVCISLNEFPYIRYYAPSNHLPLGPLKPLPQSRPPTAQETTSRWRTNLARGSEARAYESQESDYVTKLLAFMIQGNLEEHKKLNPEFGVRYFSPC